MSKGSADENTATGSHARDLWQRADYFLPLGLRGDAYSPRRARLAVLGSFIIGVALLIGWYFRQPSENEPLYINIFFLSVVSFAFIVPWLVRYTSRLAPWTALLMGGANLGLLGLGYYEGGLYAPVVVSLPAIPLMTTFLFGLRVGVFTALLNMTGLAVLAWPLLGMAWRGEVLAGSLLHDFNRFIGAEITVLVVLLFAALYDLHERWEYSG